MAAAQGSQPCARAPCCTQAIGPGAGGIDDQWAVHGVNLTIARIAHTHAAQRAGAVAQQFFGSQVIHGYRAQRLRLLQHPQHQAGVVGLGILIAHGAFQPRLRDVGSEQTQGIDRLKMPTPLPGERVVHGQTRLQEPAPRARSAYNGRQTLTAKPAPAGCAAGARARAPIRGEPQLALTHITQPAVYQLG